MTTLREAAQQALEAFGEIAWSNNSQWQADRAKVAITALRAAIEQAHGDWNEVEALRASLREHMAEIHRLRAVIEQPEPNARALHKMMIAMMQMNWRRIDPQWKDDPELCHAFGYEAGYNDAVARRAEPRASGSGAGFESLPASPQWQGLTDEERGITAAETWGSVLIAPQSYQAFARAIEAKLKEKNHD